MVCPFKIGDHVKVYGFGLVDEDGKLVGLFEGEPGVVEHIELEEHIVHVRMDGAADIARIHFIQAVPLQNLS